MEMKEIVKSTNNSVLRCGDIMEILGVSDGKAYGIMLSRTLNKSPIFTLNETA